MTMPSIMAKLREHSSVLQICHRRRWGHGLVSVALTGLLFVAVPASAADWWTLSDKDFAEQYASKALSNNLVDQSTVAWMLFARLNQPQSFNGRTYSKWELWPSNEDTFSPAVEQFVEAKKVRTRPHLQAPKVTRLKGHEQQIEHLGLPSSQGGEEVTRNRLSYDYIVGRNLNTQDGVWKLLTSSDPKVDLPVGAVEIKADWVRQPIDGAYQIKDPKLGTVYSLVGLHIMAKMAPTSNDVFHSEEPSWFWTTFEFKGNAGLTHAQSLITYNDALSPAQSGTLLTQAGLGKLAFMNYRSNGTQIRYSDTKNPTIILGNTTMEGFAGAPNPNDPGSWTSWNSSCHTCHGTASGSGTSKKFYPFTVPVGKITNPAINSFSSLDFIWSIPFHAQ